MRFAYNSEWISSSSFPGTACCIWSVISPIPKLNRWSSSLRLLCHVPWTKDQLDWDWRFRLNDTATHCNTLQHTATHCNTLQHTATHCNTLQHIAAHCNRLEIQIEWHSKCNMGWLRLVGSLKLQVSFAEYSLFYRALLQKRPTMRLRLELQIEWDPKCNMLY